MSVVDQMNDMNDDDIRNGPAYKAMQLLRAELVASGLVSRDLAATMAVSVDFSIADWDENEILVEAFVDLAVRVIRCMTEDGYGYDALVVYAGQLSLEI